MASELHRPPTALSAVAIVGAVLAALLAGVAIAQFAGFAMQDELERKVLTRPSPELERLHQREAERLSTYRWVDQKSDVVRIPVDRALELTVRDWRAE